MTIAEIQQEIMRMKKEQDVCILAHAYQSQDILEVADYMGDSYGLSVQASKSRCKNVIMCGCLSEQSGSNRRRCRRNDGSVYRSRKRASCNVV